MLFSRATLRSVITCGAVAAFALVAAYWLPDPFSASGVALGMAGVIDANAWTEKLLRKVGQSGTDWENGVKNPSTSPTAAMKRAKGRYANEMAASLQEKRWDKAIDKLTDQDIIEGAIAAGGGRFTAGVTSREPKIRAAIQALQPKVAALKARLDAMPIDTDANREAKMIEAKRGMQAIGRELAGLGR